MALVTTSSNRNTSVGIKNKLLDFYKMLITARDASVAQKRLKSVIVFTIGTASANSAKFRGIRPRIFLKDLL